jgi:hypothetical protein
MVDNQRRRGAKVAGFGLLDLKPDRCVALRPNRKLSLPDGRSGHPFPISQAEREKKASQHVLKGMVKKHIRKSDTSSFDAT